MTFRNPLTSLSADAITPGTLTGSVVQTGTTGRRVVIDTDPDPSVTFYSGGVEEQLPASVTADTILNAGNSDGVLRLLSPKMEKLSIGVATRQASLELIGNSTGSANPWSIARLVADDVALGRADATALRYDEVAGWRTDAPLEVGGLEIGGVPAGWAGRRESLNTDPTTGMITVNHGLGYLPTLALACVTREGSATEAIAQLADIIVWSKTATQITFRVRRIDTNAWFLNNLVGFYWIAK